MKNIAIRVSVITVIINLLLAVFKLVAGILSVSFAMIADALHSASDIFTTLIVMVGIKISAKSADRNHQYGHERFESVAAILLSVLLCAAGLFIGYAGVGKIVTQTYVDATAFTTLALTAAIVSIVIKEWMFWYARSAAKKTGSGALMADAWHHRSDALSSFGALVGILGVMFGFAVLDAIVSLIICVLIVWTSAIIFVDAVRKMTDEAASPETVRQIKEKILSNRSVISVDMLHTRKFGNRLYVDIEIGVDKNETFVAAHDTAEQVENSLKRAFYVIKNCTVHVNPKESN
jgi:cation diffusion facilitator family transporter